MDAKQRRTRLGRLTGHLVANTKREKSTLDSLFNSLSRSTLSEDIKDCKKTQFSFENADLLSEETISPERLETLQSLAEQSLAQKKEATFRVLVREVPVRSTQLEASLPLWAGGAAVDHTIGPIANGDGRLFWFDFFRIEKLVSLYVQGNPNPMLQFKVKTGLQSSALNQPLSLAALPSYRLGAGSIWINSQLLAANAPNAYFTGLTIESGLVTLDTQAQWINGNLTVSAGTKVSVQLVLQQQPVLDGDASRSYGQDARDMQLSLPDTLHFEFTGQNSHLDQVGESSWEVLGQHAHFHWHPQQSGGYDHLVNRVLIPLSASPASFRVSNSQSPFLSFSGEAPISGRFWALPSAPIDIVNPSPAEGTGAILVIGASGLSASWQGLKGGALQLNQPYIMAAPGRIAISDLAAGNVFSHQNFDLWQDEQNEFGSSVGLHYLSAGAFFYNSLANGVEFLAAQVDADVRADRPVTVVGEALEIRSKNSLLILALTDVFRLIYLFDDNILFDRLGPTNQPQNLPKPISLALHNALFKVTPVNGCALFGLLSPDLLKVEQGFLFLSMGMFAYLPSLPDPYAANINRLKYQFRGSPYATVGSGAFGNQNIWQWLVSLIQWQPVAEAPDQVTVSFHFAPLQNQFQIPAPEVPTEDFDFNNLHLDLDDVPQGYLEKKTSAAVGKTSGLPDYGDVWRKVSDRFNDDYFSLLDVSSNADLLGISFSVFDRRRMALPPRTNSVKTTNASLNVQDFSLRVQGMDVVSHGMNVRTFTVPQISWEPVLNLSPPQLPNNGDPDFGPNYYPDDGGPMRLLNNSAEQIALAPIPLTDFIVDKYENQKNFSALSSFTLPFGMRALALLQKKYTYQNEERPGAQLSLNSKIFPNDVKGARQLELDGGEALREGESDMFMGSTLQTNNILNMFGNPTGDSTLGGDVTKIFNNEWLLQPLQIIRDRGVPLERIDLSGYGASTFSNWLNPKAAMAETSQAKFDIFLGRCAHEVIQVKSVMYPWAIKVVRTITLFRTASNYVYRFDSGWKAESDGEFDFTYYVYEMENGKLVPKDREANYDIHPGVVKGLFNVQDIRNTEEILPFTGSMFVPPGESVINEVGEEIPNPAGTSFDFELQPVFFDTDIEIENVISGFASKKLGGLQKKLVPAKGIVGFVQIAPRGIPVTKEVFRDMINRQLGTIGGPIDCVVDIGESGQQMRLNQFDISNAFDQNGVDPVFCVSSRGSVLLPKDGSWSMVKHQFGTGDVNPVPAELSVPLVRIGKLTKENGKLVPDPKPEDALLRIANPSELLRSPVDASINYGFLQTTDTQKALFLTPAFQQGLDKLLSKTPPLFADGFRIANSKAIFPNIGQATNDFGDAISLYKNGNEFVQKVLTDGGTQVLEIMKINDTVAAIKKEGYKLLRDVASFDLPQTEWVLVELGGAFKIYIEYKADKPKQGTKSGTLDFDVDSFTDDLAEQWKSRMSNLAIVADLGPIDRLMSIKGNWDAKKGA
ncbi:hypothetical protein MNBD_NITROSPIRAE01-1, partial [hydrothermal vent metagenome]